MTNDLLAPTTPKSPTVFSKTAGVVHSLLMLRDDLGNCIKHWLVRQSKCTIGSALTCTVHCDLPGIAPHHALLVIGAKQVFLRALAPRLSRNGLPISELLLTDESNTFEIAGHRFEFSREVIDMSKVFGDSGRTQAAGGMYSIETRLGGVTGALSEPPAARPASTNFTPQGKQEFGKPGRIKFSLARSSQLNRNSDEKTEQPTTTLNPNLNLSPDWIAQILQSAIAPLHAKLHEMTVPTVNRKHAVKRNRRRKSKRSQAHAALPSFGSESTQRHNEELIEHTQQLSESQRTIENLMTQQAVRIESITERMSDITCQIADVERIIAESLSDEVTRKAEWNAAGESQAARQVESIEQLQNRMDGLAELIRQLQSTQVELHSQQAEICSSTSGWQNEITLQLASLPLPAAMDQLHLGMESLAIALRDLQSQHIAASSDDSSWREAVCSQIAQLQLSTDALAHLQRQSQAPQSGPLAERDMSALHLHAHTSTAHTDNSFQQLHSAASFPAYELIDWTPQSIPVVEPEVSKLPWLPLESAETAVEPAQSNLNYQIAESVHSNNAGPDSSVLTAPEAKLPWLLSPTSEQPPEDFAGDDAIQNLNACNSPHSDEACHADDKYLGFPEEQEFAAEQVPSCEQSSRSEQAHTQEQSDNLERDHSQQHSQKTQLPSWWTDDEASEPTVSSEEQSSSMHSLESYNPPSSEMIQSTGSESFEHSSNQFERSVWPVDSEIVQPSFESSPAAELAGSLELTPDSPDTDIEAIIVDASPVEKIGEYQHQENQQAGQVATSDDWDQLSGSYHATADEDQDENNASDPLSERLDRLLGHVEHHVDISEKILEAAPAAPVVSIAHVADEVDDYAQEPSTSIENTDIARAQAPESGESDESVEDYMRRLLARMRGVSESEVQIPSSTPELKKVAEPGARFGEKKTTTPVPKVTNALPPESIATQRFDPEKYVPRGPAPEGSRNLAAMRELANSSARSAIQVSARRRYGAAILLKLSISLVGFIAGCTLLMINGLAVNIALIATVAAFLVGAIWGYDGLSSIKPLLASGKHPGKPGAKDATSPDKSADRADSPDHVATSVPPVNSNP